LEKPSRHSDEVGEAKSVLLLWTMTVETLLEEEKRPGGLPVNDDAETVEP
jgi:hypothetical protein